MVGLIISSAEPVSKRRFGRVAAEEAKKIIGDLSNEERVLVGLDVQSVRNQPS